MCIVNLSLVADIAPLAGAQTEIMRRIGISWNSWIKVSAGLPIRVSVGRRLRERVVAQAHKIEGFRRRFPDPASPDGIDWQALESVFLTPASAPPEVMKWAPRLRSVGRARQMVLAQPFGTETELRA